MVGSANDFPPLHLQQVDKLVSKTVQRAASEAVLGSDVLLSERFKVELLWIYLSAALNLQRQSVGWSAVAGGIWSDLLCSLLQGLSVTTATGEAFFSLLFSFSPSTSQRSAAAFISGMKPTVEVVLGDTGQEPSSKNQRKQSSFILASCFFSNSQNPSPVKVTWGFLPVKAIRPKLAALPFPCVLVFLLFDPMLSQPLQQGFFLYL